MTKDEVEVLFEDAAGAEHIWELELDDKYGHLVAAETDILEDAIIVHHLKSLPRGENT